MSIALVPWPLIRHGSEGHEVRSLQYLLRSRNYTIAVDGIFGSQTDSVVREFQRDNELVVDGIVGPNTWSKVIVMVALGSGGDAVRAVQEEVNLVFERCPALDLSVAVDGDAGPRTDAVIRAFQVVIAHVVTPFPVDGIVGPLTWRALIGGQVLAG